MIRRDFFRSSLLTTVSALSSGKLRELSASAVTTGEFPSAPGLTKYVSDFVVNAKYGDIPENVIALGKKTLLDGFGLALAGSASGIGPLIRRYIETLGFSDGKASIIGTSMKAPARFAALANGMYVILDWHAIGWPITTIPARRCMWRPRCFRRYSRSVNWATAAAKS